MSNGWRASRPLFTPQPFAIALDPVVIAWLRGGTPFPLRGVGAAGAERPARGRRRPLAAPAARWVPPRDLPLVLGGRPDPVVEPGPADGSLPARAARHALPRQDAAEQVLRGPLRHRLRRGGTRLRRAAAEAARHLDQRGDAGRVPPPPRARLCALRGDLGRRRARRRAVRRRAGPRLFRRIDVRPRARRVQDRVRPPRPAARRRGLPPDRLPDAYPPPRLARRTGGPAVGGRPPPQGLGRLPAAAGSLGRGGRTEREDRSMSQLNDLPHAVLQFYVTAAPPRR